MNRHLILSLAVAASVMGVGVANAQSSAKPLDKGQKTEAAADKLRAHDRKVDAAANQLRARDRVIDAKYARERAAKKTHTGAVTH